MAADTVAAVPLAVLQCLAALVALEARLLVLLVRQVLAVEAVVALEAESVALEVLVFLAEAEENPPLGPQAVQVVRV